MDFSPFPPLRYFPPHFILSSLWMLLCSFPCALFYAKSTEFKCYGTTKIHFHLFYGSIMKSFDYDATGNKFPKVTYCFLRTTRFFLWKRTRRQDAAADTLLISTGGSSLFLLFCLCDQKLSAFPLSGSWIGWSIDACSFYTKDDRFLSDSFFFINGVLYKNYGCLWYCFLCYNFAPLLVFPGFLLPFPFLSYLSVSNLFQKKLPFFSPNLGIYQRYPPVTWKGISEWKLLRSLSLFLRFNRIFFLNPTGSTWRALWQTARFDGYLCLSPHRWTRKPT